MSDHGIPYMAAYGNITKTLEAITKAQTPERFTQDFLATKLAIKGGNAKPVIPFLKKTGFLGSDGTPTDLYKQFRNPSQSGAAAAQALRKGFAPLYEINEYAHDLDDQGLKGIIVQATGTNGESSTLKSILGSFKALSKFATDDPKASKEPVHSGAANNNDGNQKKNDAPMTGLNLGYTINVHLPATSDIAVYNAIFKSLREHILG